MKTRIKLAKKNTIILGVIKLINDFSQNQIFHTFKEMCDINRLIRVFTAKKKIALRFLTNTIYK